MPVKLGASSDEVHKLLGRPNESYVKRMRMPPEDETQPEHQTTLEWYYCWGVVASFEHDKLFSIGLPAFCDYQGFLIYSGTVVKGVKVTDSKQAILKALGKPTKIESDAVPVGADPNVPVVWPKESRYYWQFSGYTLEAAFLQQAQSVQWTSEPHTWPKDGLTSMYIVFSSAHRARTRQATKNDGLPHS